MSSFAVTKSFSKMTEYTTIIALVQAGISIILNSLLLLACRNCYVKIGNYKRFIIAYGILDIVLCICHALMAPVYIYSDGTLTLMATGIFNYSKSFQPILLLHCGSQLALALLLCNSFIYRVALFNELIKNMYSSSIGIATMWCVAISFILNNVGIAQIKFSQGTFSWTFFNRILTEYNTDLYETPLITGLITTSAIIGDIWNFIITFQVFSSIISVQGINIFCSIYILRRLNNSQLNRRTEELHRRLVYLLMTQCALPFITLYLPYAVCMVCSFLQINVAFPVSTALSILSGFFPILNPLSILFFIKRYRIFIFGRKCTRNNVTTTTERTKSIAFVVKL